ncbi:MAG: twin-arginine translocation signal domain-containing protein, partial [Verrucomicrobia bacterium]|nr:twin-arginine translocation signal domain-containing protein [Verrucomicrobiota bacterium]
MKKILAKITRRDFLAASTTGATAFTIVPRNVLGAPAVPPSEKLGGALIGCGGGGPGTYTGMCKGLNVERLAACVVCIRKDQRFGDSRNKGKAKALQGFRRPLGRDDNRVVSIGT